MSDVTNNFYISGNYIAEQHIESQTINYTGNAREHVGDLEEGNEPAEETPSNSMPLAPEFKYIHYKVTDPKKRSEVSLSVSHIVRLPKMAQVCAALKQLMKEELVLSSIEQSAMLTELRRLGLPDGSTQGFSDQNFYSSYNK